MQNRTHSRTGSCSGGQLLWCRHVAAAPSRSKGNVVTRRYRKSFNSRLHLYGGERLLEKRLAADGRPRTVMPLSLTMLIPFTLISWCLDIEDMRGIIPVAASRSIEGARFTSTISTKSEKDRANVTTL
ncbi:Hypothetical protein SMAX5B_016314 [Scophthalmus maximus]|uniref:Uncharacterized protein n=1 Tax=Scophthalmus maximus TaxID=52904 RepID=A0A2U9BL79_SCOMX|nr:Hypothetical protein SMAX5B_016314 [Scophthalmus maximus]